MTHVDADLVEALRQRDELAFAELVDSWSPAMLRYAHSFVRSHASAEDVVQETWLAVVRGISDFRGDTSLRGWTFRILANIARRRGGKDALSVPIGLASDPPAYDASRFRTLDEPWPGHWRSDSAPTFWHPEEQLLTAEARAVVEVALKTLPERQRVVVELRDVHGLTSGEVCEALQISAENQRVLLHRGRSRVRDALEEHL